MFTQKCVAKSDTGGHGRGKKFDDNEFVLKQLEKDHLTIFMNHFLTKTWATSKVVEYINTGSYAKVL